MRMLLALAALALFAFSACDAGRTTTRDARATPTPEPSESPRTPREFVLGRDEATALLCRVLDERDIDCDRRITVDDDRAACASRLPSCPSDAGRKPYVVTRANGYEIALPELHQASQLVQELVLGHPRRTCRGATRPRTRANAKPGAYLEQRIEEHFWDALTRRIDRDTRTPAPGRRGSEARRSKQPRAGSVQRSRRTLRAQNAGSSRAKGPEDPELFVYYPGERSACPRRVSKRRDSRKARRSRRCRANSRRPGSVSSRGQSGMDS